MTADENALLDKAVEEYQAWLDGGPRRRMTFTAWLGYISRHYKNETATQVLALLKGK